MKKALVILIAIGFVLASCAGPMDSDSAERAAWATLNRGTAIEITAEQWDRGNASAGADQVKISATGTSAMLPGLTYLWWGQSANQGMIRVEDKFFDAYEGIKRNCENCSILKAEILRYRD